MCVCVCVCNVWKLERYGIMERYRRVPHRTLRWLVTQVSTESFWSVGVTKSSHMRLPAPRVKVSDSRVCACVWRCVQVCVTLASYIVACCPVAFVKREGCLFTFPPSSGGSPLGWRDR